MTLSSTIRSLSLACALALFALAAAWIPSAHATPLQPGFAESIVFSGLTEPTDVAFAPDGRVFVSEKSGLIKVFPELNAPSPTIAADLRTQVHNFWDRGLLSIVLDPQFPMRPYLYALYSADAAIGGTAPRWGEPNATSDGCPTPPGPTDAGCVISTRLVKLTLSGSVVTGEQTLINDWCQQFPSHSAGGLAFGPDGMLYVSGGDGASFNYTDYGQEGNPCGDPPGGTMAPPTAEGGALRSQDYLTPSDPTGLNGSLIRINPDTGAAAPGNPMSTSADANARRIVAAGMRNPFRFTFRPGTSEIFIGDVGWGSWEEIDRLPKADDATVDNFGWPCYEGVGRTAGYEGAGLNLCKQLYNTPGSVTPPLFTYSHSADVVPGENCTAAGSSISGLAFYQGGAYPAAYKGALFFADYSRRCTWVMFEKNGQPDPTTVTSFLNNNDPVNLKIGPEGDLFLVDFTGSVRRISYPGGNRAPTAVAVAQPKAGPLPLTVNFDGTGSTDPDAGDVLTYAWDLDGDGQYDDSTAAKPTWTYNSAGSVTVRLRVTDKGGQSATDSIVVGPGNDAPHAQIDTPTAALHWAVGDPISFSGQGSDPQDGTLGPGRMSWAVVMRHCHTASDCHSHPIQSYPGVAEGTFTAPDHEYPSYLELRLTVTDSAGLTDTATLRLDPRTVDLTFRSEPPGLTLGAGQQSSVAPFTQTVIVGSRNSLAAPTPQTQNSSLLGFASWSDGGAATHDVIAPATATTYTATYKPESGLVAAYGFEETSGTAVNDSSPAKNNGTAVGGPLSTAAGRFGRALSFDGVNDLIRVPYTSSLDLNNGMTLEAWVQPKTSRIHAPVITKRTTNYYSYRLEAGGEVKGVPEGYLSDAPWSWEDVEDTKPLPNGSWSHITMTYDGATMRLYVNGALVATHASPKPHVDGGELTIGGNDFENFYEGLIDEVRIYNRVLNATEIGTDMNTAVVSSGPTDSTPPSQPGNLTATGSLGKVTLGWNASTDNVGVSGYEVYRSTTAGFTPAVGNRIATTTGTGTGYVDTTAPGTYYYRVKALDAAGNLSTSSAEASGTATADTTAPTVSLTAPAAGTVSGTVALKATAADNVGVSGVQFLVDGVAFGAEDTSAPYEIQWPSTGVTNGTHKLAARARDAANNTTTSAEVTVTVSNTAAPSGLVAAYGFEETSGTTVNDSSPAKNNGTAVGGPLSTAAGRFGRALSFDGVNDKVEVPDSASLELTNALTVEAWVQPKTSRLHAPVVTKETSSFYTYKLEAGGEVKGIPEGFISDAPWSWEDAEDTKTLTNGSWTHLAMTYDGTNMRLYVNGTLVSTRVAAKPTADGLKLLIGAYKTTNFYEGLIDEVRIYNRVLNATEIGTDMNTAVVSSGPTDSTPPSQPGNLTATGSLGKVTLGWNASTDNVGVSGYEVYRSTTAGFTPAVGNRIATTTGTGTGYVDTTAPGTYYYRVKALDAAGNLSTSSAEASGTATADTTAPTVSLTAPAAGTVSGTVALKATAADNVGVSGVQFLVDGVAFGAEDTSAPYEIQWPSTGVTNGTHKLAARARDAANNTTTSAEVTVTVSNTAAPSGLVAAYGFEETSGTTVNDSSPAKNNGTAVGGPLSTAAGRFGRALSFDGVNDKVEVPDSASLELTNALTVEAWVQPKTSRLHAPVVTKETSSFYTYKLEAGGEVKGIPEGFISDAPWSWEDAEDTKTLTNGSWTHLAMTYDGTNMRLYVNGTLVSTRVAAKPTADGLKLLIGAYKTTNFYEGLIDEVRIYNRVLNATEIGTDMNTAVTP